VLIFHTFTLPENRFARLLVRNLGRGMPDGLFREELKSLNTRVQGITQLRIGRHDPDHAKYCLPTLVSLARGREVSNV